MRYSVFAPDGSLVGTHRPDIVGYSTPRRSALDDGSYLDWRLEFPDGRFGARTRFHPIRFSAHFSRTDTFPPIEHTLIMAEVGLPLLNFGNLLVAAPDRSGRIYFADSRDYRVFRRDLEGDTTLEFTLAAKAAPIGDAEREQVRARWSHRPEIAANQIAALPKTKPVLYGIVPDNAGHVFVFADVADEVPGTVVDVFEESGKYLGRMRMPIPIRLGADGRPPVVFITRDELYIALTDKFNVPFVARFSIVKGDDRRTIAAR